MADHAITSVLDTRVPQPGRESEYGVPVYLAEAVEVLYQYRRVAPDADVAIIDETILRIYGPYIRNRNRRTKQQRSGPDRTSN